MISSWRIWRKRRTGRHEGKRRRRREEDLAAADAYLRVIKGEEGK
jgi:hypothetical protein